MRGATYPSAGAFSSWSPPVQGVVKVNVDASSWKRVNECCHIGVVLRDTSSRCLAVRREVVAPSALVAEARGVLEGCVMAKQMGLLEYCDGVGLEGDYLSAKWKY